mmetsp:Transcript_7046/g.7300  ORF Transcript_7046/g.7300 Transcript_7046/m.7300 type:complete len:123 (+) Transcript_7046:507-875(+)
MFSTIEKTAVDKTNSKKLMSLMKEYKSAEAGVNLLADYFQLVRARSYRMGCYYSACLYGTDKYYKVYQCLFNTGIKEGEMINSDSMNFDKSLFEEVKEMGTLWVPKGFSTNVHYSGVLALPD